jgi:hypothetical protein
MADVFAIYRQQTLSSDRFSSPYGAKRQADELLDVQSD